MGRVSFNIEIGNSSASVKTKEVYLYLDWDSTGRLNPPAFTFNCAEGSKTRLAKLFDDTEGETHNLDRFYLPY
ncbi:MAG: hypothetical protein ACI9Y1_001015 [Lentisphaeria bacterium]|jgi:hypothetical protein